MPVGPDRKRVGWPVLVALLVALALAAIVVWRADLGAPPITGGAEIGAVSAEVAPTDADTWQHHAWVIDGGAPTGERVAPPTDSTRGYDPQRTAMERAFGSRTDGGLPFAPTTRAARVVRREGAFPADAGASCEVRVLPARSGRFDCLVRVTCGGAVIYPNPSQTAGYNTCELVDGAPVRVDDRGPTAVDGDPRIILDLRAGTVEVDDAGDGVDAFRATLRLAP